AKRCVSCLTFRRQGASCFSQSSPAPGKAVSARAVTKIRIIGSFRKGACTARPTPSHYKGMARCLAPWLERGEVREAAMDDLLKPPEWLIKLMPDARGFLEGGGWLAILGTGGLLLLLLLWATVGRLFRGRSRREPEAELEAPL